MLVLRVRVALFCCVVVFLCMHCAIVLRFFVSCLVLCSMHCVVSVYTLYYVYCGLVACVGGLGPFRVLFVVCVNVVFKYCVLVLSVSCCVFGVVV